MPAQKIFSYKPTNENAYNHYGRLILGIYVNNTPQRQPQYQTAYLRRGWEFSHKRAIEVKHIIQSRQKSARETLFEVKNLFNDLLPELFLTRVINNKNYEAQD
jgi:hypothetical protein